MNYRFWYSKILLFLIEKLVIDCTEDEANFSEVRKGISYYEISANADPIGGTKVVLTALLLEEAPLDFFLGSFKELGEIRLR